MAGLPTTVDCYKSIFLTVDGYMLGRSQYLAADGNIAY